MIHRVKGFSIVNEAEVDGRCFLELSSFFYDPTDVGNLISDSSAIGFPSDSDGKEFACTMGDLD